MTNISRALNALLLLFCAGSFLIVGAQQKFNGSYTTYIGGRPTTEESYVITINPDGSVQSEADVQGGTVKSHLVTTATAKSPVKFLITVGDTTVLTAEVDAGSATINVAGQPQQNVKTTASLVLENGAWHQFVNLLRQYDSSRGGAQSFKALLPSQAREFSLQLEWLESPSYDSKGQKIATEHYRITTGAGLALEIWSDPDRVPMVINIPSQDIKVIRRGREDLAENLFGKSGTKTTGNFTSEEVLFNNGAVRLAGTLTLPKEARAPYPAVVIITGSGGQDRDGALGVFNLYKLIAESLSNSGIAVLRVDDRGVGKSTVPDPQKPSSYSDLINDSRAAFDYLTKRADIDKTRIALAGHSEGAETALTIAADDSRVAAIALLAGCARPVDRVALEQSLYQLALNETIDPSDQTRLPADARAILKLFESARTSAPSSTRDQYTWFREHIASDPSALAKRVKCPVLVLNGERDALVLAHNAIELAQVLTSSGNRQVSLRIFPNLTHLFTPAAIDKSASPEKATEISPEMLQTLRAWATRVLLKKTT